MNAHLQSHFHSPEDSRHALERLGERGLACAWAHGLALGARVLVLRHLRLRVEVDRDAVGEECAQAVLGRLHRALLEVVFADLSGESV